MIKWENASRMLSKDLCSQNQVRPPGSMWGGPLPSLSPYTSPPISGHKLQPEPLSFPELQTHLACPDSAICFLFGQLFFRFLHPWLFPYIQVSEFSLKRDSSSHVLLSRDPFPWWLTLSPISLGLLCTEFTTICSSYPHAHKRVCRLCAEPEWVLQTSKNLTCLV